ncbi:hypothetical protein PGTUg99_008519 [Puccinia graminis f. sp. tritici]|uniref:Uncharacterized protein n=1 Tax=Puccinia graminis f. sp. tritici TaxID=56615 RepID=A0A5B0RTH8_PUCGR|nr:hypothetical protein PGTUg99_008519 [Puccinia graminis f. sp. tritici]
MTEEQLTTNEQQQQHKNNNNNNHHHSRLTRFLSKFTINPTNHSKRKSSLPNLNLNNSNNNNSNNNRQTEIESNTTKQRSLSHHPQDTQKIKLDSISLQPLLPLPTIIDRHSNSSSSAASTNQENHHHSEADPEDGADPNASIRPITPSSKANSFLPSPSETPTHQHQQQQPALNSPTQSRHSYRPTKRSSTISNSSSEPILDDCKSTFGNSSLASTKPTTVISLENGPANRIAQPHPSPITTHHYHNHNHNNHNPNHNHHNNIINHSNMAQPAQNNLRNPIRAAIINHQRVQSASSSIINQPIQPTTPSLTLHSSPPISPQNHFSIINVPRHSLPHPSQNPHPAALADNASILTLASSGFSPSLHHQQNFPSDEDASVRALAPSRRESIESLSSRWSNVKSTRTGGSIRTTGTGFYTGIGPSSSVQNDSVLTPVDQHPGGDSPALFQDTSELNIPSPLLLPETTTTTPLVEPGHHTLDLNHSSPVAEKTQLAQEIVPPS